MEKIYTILLLTLASCWSYAQNYGNEWIQHHQKYYAFAIYKDGMYKIDYATLNANNIPVTGYNSKNIQLFGREKEIALYMVDGGDDTFDPGDYFVFLAQGNDSWMDSIIVPDPSKLANPNYSLISDTNFYFFTWSVSANGLRYTVDPDQNFGAYTPVNFVEKEVESNYANFYVEGKKLDHASGSIYSEGEGYGYYELASTTGGFQNIGMLTPNPYSGTDAPSPTLEVRSSSNSDAQVVSSINNHHLKLTAGYTNTVILDSVFNGYKQIQVNATLPYTALGNGYTYLKYEIIADLGVAVDRQVLTYYKLNYARLPNAGGANYDFFRLPNSLSGAKSRIDITGLNATNPLALIQGSNYTAHIPFNNTGTWQTLVPNNSSGSESTVFIYDLATAPTIGTFYPVNGTGDFVDYSLLNLDGALLMIAHDSLMQASMSYAAYRGTPSGGSYNVILANIEDLQYQFGGGVPFHPASIRRFADYVADNAGVKPSGLFLMGKGYSPNYIRTDSTAYLKSFIPTLGYPSSDNAITCGLNGTLFEPLIPTGRIAVRNNQELAEYLAKVQEYEAAQNPGSNFSEVKDWQKQILHFVGGSDASQQASFQSFMTNMENIIEDSLYAGHVTNYYKTSSDPLDPSVVAGVTEKIESGVSLMNFFGHSAVSNNGFEINIDEPSNWDNQGKYPVVIGNSCYNGDIFNGGYSTSERFVIIPNEGAISFLSSVFVGYDSYLAVYTTELYRQISNENVGKSIAFQIQQTIKNLQNASDNLIMESTYSQMVYHGDPVIKINFSTAPEIEITPQQVTFSPTDLNLNVDSIQLDIEIKNLGLSVMDPVVLEIRRDFPNSSVDSVYTILIPELQYSTLVTKKLPLQANIGIGINQFSISIDIPSVYPEQFEEISNNRVNTNFFINIDGINPVWPYNYAVVPYDTVTVKASTINPIADLKTYRFELDTTDTYDSPQLRTFSVTELGGVKEVRFDQWLSPNGSPFPLICTDSTVYFWRAALDSSVLNWSEFSFQYIPGKRGWGQDHFFQFKNNSFNGVEYNRSVRLREFPPTQLHNVSVDVFQSYDAIVSLYNAWNIDGSIVDYATCGYLPAIYVGVVDSVTLQAWKTHCPGGSPSNNNPAMNFGNYNNNCGCRNRYEMYFVFDQTSASSLAALQNMLENEIPDNDYVVVYTPFSTLYSQWDALAPSLYTTFQNIGAPEINNTQEEKPFALFFKKGTTSMTQVKIWPQDTVTSAGFPAKLNLLANVYKPDYIGLEWTPMIGPATEWKTVYWRRDSIEDPSTDSVRLYIQGYDMNGNLLTTIDTLFSPNDSITNLNALLDAATYPQMKLGVYYYDITNSSPAQVDRLHVLYSPVPEAAIDGSNAYYLNPITDTLFEGQQISFAVDVKNISDYPMDSLLVKYWVEDENHNRDYISYPRQGPLSPEAVIRDTISFSTVNLAGLNSFWMEVNPYISGSQYITDQPEQYHFNNLLQLPFVVDGDDEHPILDVTFNGKHILNGDIIDPNSEILITLKDENPYLIMSDISDTANFGIYLTDPQGIQTRIPFIDGNGNTVMQWIPAEAQYKKFKIIYPKEFEQNGIYTLIVQGTDRSGNLSGDYEYRVNFEIVRESSITHMMNYPNPFSTSTRFVFTLTGTQAPEDVLIQIMTVTGRVVKEINENELGRIEIGRNITEYAWDGKDNFGDPLANGVYLYRVKAKINGEDIKLRQSGADTYFKEEFGKMYLFR